MKKKATLNTKKLSSIDKIFIKEELSAKMKKTRTPKNVVSTSSIPVTNKNEEKLSKKDKPKKIKMIRSSFTLTEEDYANLSELKNKCLEAGVHIKKSELMRAGLLGLFKLNEVALFKSVEIIKKGHPPKE